MDILESTLFGDKRSESFWPGSALAAIIKWLLKLVHTIISAMAHIISSLGRSLVLTKRQLFAAARGVSCQSWWRGGLAADDLLWRQSWGWRRPREGAALGSGGRGIGYPSTDWARAPHAEGSAPPGMRQRSSQCPAASTSERGWGGTGTAAGCPLKHKYCHSHEKKNNMNVSGSYYHLNQYCGVKITTIYFHHYQALLY